MKMIDFLKLRTYSQKEIIKLRELNLLPDFPKKGSECYKLNDRLKFEFRSVFEADELVGYAYADVILYPHFLFNAGKHNGNDFSPINCIKVLDEVFKQLNVSKNNLNEYEVVNIEFGVNVIPETDIKEVINSIKYWKRKPFKRNKADFSLITQSTAHKQIKAYAKGIDDLERLKSNEVHPNTFRFEIKQRKSQEIVYSMLKTKDSKVKFTTDCLFKIAVYERFQELLRNDLDLILFIENPKSKKGLSGKEKAALKALSNTDKWNSFLDDKNRDKFNYQRKKYEKICQKTPTIKDEIRHLIEQKFTAWKNSAILPKKIMQKESENQIIKSKKFCNSTIARIL